MLVTLAVTITIVLIIIVAALLRIDNWSRDFTENSAAVEADFADPVSTIDSRLQQWIADQSRWDIQSKTESDGTIEYEITRTTPVFRFVDDIEIRLVLGDDGTNTRITATSQSRVGKGDLGQNPRNLSELLKALQMPSE
ncbi:DUF1499 domain-containing protein [Novipirellula caenicola]|uniref:DUF1499 domain-containing protein n=1 Tax=Novipirellula caenicola TaxID=1536901 RepID=A0ABP9VJY0_9BACT